MDYAKTSQAMSRCQAMQALAKQIAVLRSGKPVGPRTYEVNIKADPAHMLDWDKPLVKQPSCCTSC